MSGNKSFSSESHYLREFKSLAERASRDMLSGLFNRATAVSHIEEYLDRMQQGDVCALFMIDLDKFKLVNDTLGHPAGDRVIQLAARAISGCFRPTDIVGRLGGDEFFALFTGRISEEAVHARARALCDALRFSVGEAPEIQITASVGVYIATAAAHDFDSLYRNADAALRQAKDNGRNTICIRSGQESNNNNNNNNNSLNCAIIQFPSILEHMEEGVFLIELNDTAYVTYASPVVCRMMGVDTKTLDLPCELSTFGRPHPDDMAELLRHLKDAAMHDGISEYEYRFSIAEGEWRWCRARIMRHGPACPRYPVLLVFCTDISAIRRRDHLLSANYESLKLVQEQGGFFLWVLDTTTRTCKLFSTKRPYPAPYVSINNFPESLITRGWVHPDSANRFRDFADEMLSGNLAGSGVFILRHKMSRSYGWYAVAYSTVPDRDRMSPRIVGLARYLPDFLDGQEKLWEALRPNLFAYLRIDISDDHVETLWAEDSHPYGPAQDMNCEVFIDKERKQLFCREDRDDLVAAFSRDALLKSFALGHHWVSREFRRVDLGGVIRWIAYTAYLSRHEQTGHVQAFLFLQDVQLRHTWENSLGENIHSSPVSGMYSRKTARLLAESIMRDSASPGLNTLALVHITGLSELEKDVQAVAHRRTFVHMAFSLLLGPECIIGEYGRDALSIFRAAKTRHGDMRKRINDVLAFVRQTILNSGQSFPLHFTVVMNCAISGNDDYEALLRSSERICAVHQYEPQDTVIFVPAGRKTTIPAPEAPLLSPDTRSSLPLQVEVPLTEDSLSPEQKTEENLSQDQKDVLISCLRALLSKDPQKAPVLETLGHVGRHYQADRVYTLVPIEDGRAVHVLQEWTAENVHGLSKYISNMPVDRLPLLKFCLNTKKPLFINRSIKNPLQEDQRLWSYAVFPLTTNNPRTDGLLCMENPRAYQKNDALLPSLLTDIANACHLGLAGKSGRASEDPFTGLLNLNAYMDKVYLITSDNYSSLGVFTISIANAADPTEQHDAGQRAQILLHLTETLKALFGRALLFRTGTNEVVALCPNTTQEVFLARVFRTQSMLQRRYAKQIRFGHTWAEGFFSGEKLVREARAIMLCDHLETTDAPPLRQAQDRHGMNVKNLEGLERFVVFLQPKVDMRCGKTVGAEALVRGMDSHGLIVPPSRFMENMEKSGSIRTLDLFVLDSTLATMEEWRRKGLRLLPISVNFSRFTLFSPSSPGAVLAILSRYPSISPSLLEVEISEAALDVETGSLIRAMNFFRPFGLHFSLDDFGCRYSNLSLFTSVPFDAVKLDRSLIKDIASNTMSLELVGDIVGLCSTWNMTCIAEGVENQAQVDALLGVGGVYAQGFYFARPIPIQEFEQNHLIRNVSEKTEEQHADPKTEGDQA